ncbi:leucine-rich repeat protein 1 isoform X2 [Aplysia californica]|nr:leucine-rich repeat protein 1 isoform X2 [Aplysia californica]XP_005106338.1 leucine-rich repeat protein 1 isoform X2 [Aplysia californica]XP_035827759.1 leucine-rich repeat protein 1 isoform X2 [Aplysia californica]
MKLRCEVQVSDHQLCIKKPGKAAFAQVSVGRKPGHKDGPIYVMICTAQNRNGTKYVIWKNLKQIFGKFVKDGKATVRFMNPPHDLAFSKANADLLDTFLKVVKLVAQGKGLPDESLSSLAPASLKQVERPVTSLSVMSPSEYPMSFPKSLTKLMICNCRLRRVSPHVLSLNLLTTLDLSFNSLSSLPEQMSQLKSLTSLSLAHNEFVTFPIVLCKTDVRRTLLVLDMKHNEMHSVPSCIKECEKLQSLVLSSNKLHSLPQCLGHMKSLTSVSASDNKLQYLPGSMLRKTWELADFSNNPFNLSIDNSTQAASFAVPSLAEWSARSVVNHEVQFTKEDLDLHSIQYVQGAHFCVCGSACFETSVRATKKRPLWATSAYQGDVPLQMHFCSLRCLKLFNSSKR